MGKKRENQLSPCCCITFYYYFFLLYNKIIIQQQPLFRISFSQTTTIRILQYIMRVLPAATITKAQDNAKKKKQKKIIE